MGPNDGGVVLAVRVGAMVTASRRRLAASDAVVPRTEPLLPRGLLLADATQVVSSGAGLYIALQQGPAFEAPVAKLVPALLDLLGSCCNR